MHAPQSHTIPQWRRFAPLLLALAWSASCSSIVTADDNQPEADNTFTVGTATRDITPEAPVPMWGYGARHAMLSQGTLDRLEAKALVISAGGNKLAIVGADLGRGPTKAMMESIRATLKEKAGIEHVLIAGSHTHHGPVIELLDRSGYGRGSFDDAVAYSLRLRALLIEAILAADSAARPAKLGIGTKNINFNRNRQTKHQPPATEPMLAVMRFDDARGQPIAVLVNFAAHPVLLSGTVLKFSADYPGALRRKVEAELGAPCVFMQGAAGDMSPSPPAMPKADAGANNPAVVDQPAHVAFGEALAAEALGLVRVIETHVPRKPSLRGRVDRFQFGSRVNFSSSLVRAGYGTAFFPELIAPFVDDFRDGIRPELNTVLLNGEIALVAASGEFFANHSNRLKERSYLPHTLFFGYCNGHDMYFPTIEAVSEGGYGADPPVSPAEVGAGEQMMNQALKNIYALEGRITEPKTGR